MGIDHLLDDICTAVMSHQLSRNEIARRANLHPNTLRKLGRRDAAGKHEWTPSCETLRQLEAILPLPRRRA